MMGDVIELTVVVKDLDAAVERYGRLYGLREHHRLESKEFGFKSAILPLGAGHIELLQPTDPDKPAGRFLAKNGEGVYLVGFEEPPPLGVVPEAAGSLLMPVVMGNQRASLALYTGDWISADDAVAAGLALRVVPADEVLAETLAIARRIAEHPVSALVESKRLIIASRIDAVRAARAREDAAFAHMVGAAANADALGAFLDAGTSP